MVGEPSVEVADDRRTGERAEVPPGGDEEAVVVLHDEVGRPGARIVLVDRRAGDMEELDADAEG